MANFKEIFDNAKEKVESFIGQLGNGNKNQEEVEEKNNEPIQKHEHVSDFRDQEYDPTYHPNSEDKQNSGQGAAAAVGTDYSWNKQGSEKAQQQYQADVISQKQSFLNNRQTLANNAVNYQAQADMMKYQNNQNAEKVGWTGGYVLDQNRQMEYLKASIQAQMYGAIELQKYGYDSSLAAARLSYDLNQQEYARQYYQEAVQNAMNEAQLTGVYFSAETKDMMSQLSVASQKLDDPTASEEEKQQAETLIKTINKWFDSNGVSKEGVKTMAAFQFETQQNYQWLTDQWTRYEAALQAARSDVSTNATMFIKYEADQIAYDNGEVKTIDMSTLSDKELKAYYEDGEDQKKQVDSYFQYLLEEIKNKYTNVKKDSNGNETSTVNQEKINQESKELAEKYKNITGKNLDISSNIKQINSNSNNDHYSNEEEWEIVSNAKYVEDLTKLTDFKIYDNHKQGDIDADNITGNHLNLAKPLQQIIKENSKFRSCYFDFNDHGFTSRYHIWLYIDSAGNIYNISKDQMKKPWYFIGENSTNNNEATLKIYQSTESGDEKVGSYNIKY